jgi:hypothetical protein
MKISVRPVRHDSETRQLLALLRANLPDLPHERRFEWLYRANPDGPAWSWFVCQGTASEVVGIASVFPRAMWVGDQLKLCGQVGDFAINAAYRSLGPALLLQRATFAPVDEEKLAFCYDCPPHDAGMSTFRRLAMEPNCTMDRYVLPLRVEVRLRNRLGSASALPAAVGNLLLRAYRWPLSKSLPKDLEIAERKGPFGDEFSRLDTAVKDAKVIRSQRSAAHLNWRYREDPLQDYIVWTARRKGELLAYVVFRASPEVVTIIDLFGMNMHDEPMALLASLIERFGRSHQSIEALLAEGSESAECFIKMRFRRRHHAARVVAYAKPGGADSVFLRSSPGWAFQLAEIRA